MTQTKRDTPLPPGFGLGVGGTTPTRKRICVQETSEIQWTGLTNRQRPGCKEKNRYFLVERNVKQNVLDFKAVDE